MKRQKPSTRKRFLHGVVATVFLVFFLSTSITVFFDSYNRTLEEDRKLTFGAWHIAVFDTQEAVLESLSQHAAVASIGEMQLSGTVTDGENIVGGIGCFDEQLMELGNLTLLDGRYPTDADEIAMEAAVLTRLGYSLELGQKIQLNLSLFDRSLRMQEPVTYEFTLTGVIKNYASNWKSDSEWLVSCCVSEAFCQQTETKLHLFGELNSNFVPYADSLESLTRNKGFFTKNDYTYLQYSEGSAAGSGSAILHTAIILSGCLSLVILIHNELNRRKVSFVTMRILGATKMQIVLLFLKERFYGMCIAGGIGILIGVVFPSLVFTVANGLFAGNVFYQLLPGHIFQISSLCALGVFLSLCLSITRIFNTPLIGRVEQQASPPAKRRRRLNRRNVHALLKPSGRGYRLISQILTCASAVLVLFSAYEAWTVYNEYSFFHQQYPEDYSFGMIVHQPNGHLSSDDLERIQNAYGVKEAYAFSSSDYVGIHFTQEYDAPYAEASKYNVSNSIGKLPKADAYGTVVGITDSLIPVYLAECGSESANLRDNEVILFVPDLYRIKDNLYTSISEDAEEGGILQENTLKAGQTVCVSTGENQTELLVAGVIRSFSPDLAFSFHLTRPYSILCNQQTYARLFGQCQYTYVLVFGDPNAIAYQTDVELSKIQTQLHFSNNRIFRAEKLQAFTVQLVLSLIMLAASFLLNAMIRYGVQTSSNALETQKLLILHRLGMSKRTLFRAFAVQAARESIVGALASLALFVVYRCSQERDGLLSLSDYWEAEPAQVAADAFLRCLSQTQWFVVLFVLTLIVCLNFFILLFYKRKDMKAACEN